MVGGGVGAVSRLFRAAFAEIPMVGVTGTR